MLTLVKLVLLGVLIGCFGYAIVVVFPQKVRLFKRLGVDKTNADAIAAAKAGDLEAVELVRKSRRLMWIALPSALALVLIQGRTKQ